MYPSRLDVGAQVAVSNGHLVIPQGQTFTAQFRYTESDRVTPIAIPAGYQVRLRFAVRHDGSNTLTFTSSPVAGLTISSYPGGIVDLVILPAQSLNLNANVPLLWQLEAYDPLDLTQILDLGKGTVAISARVP